MFPIKPEQEMLDEMITDLESRTRINNYTPGSIARSLLEVFNNKLHTAYRYFNVYAAMMFVSTSEGLYLDMIGDTLNCERLPEEEDENYRYRITNQVFSAAMANETAIRLACLSVSGVKNVIITRYSRGSGSFTVHVLTDELDTPELVLTSVKNAIASIKAEGVRAIVSRPKLVPIDIKFSIVLNSRQEESLSFIQRAIRTELKDYFDTLGIAAIDSNDRHISFAKILAIPTAHPSIQIAYLSSFKVNGAQSVIRDRHQLGWDERPYIQDLILEPIRN